MLSRPALHAIRIIEYLARNPASQPVKIETLSLESGIPRHATIQAIRALSHWRLLSTNRGSRGGVSLTRPVVQLKMAEIVCAVDGAPSECPVSRTNTRCAPSPDCHLTRQWTLAEQELHSLVIHGDLQSFIANDVHVESLV